MKKISGFMLAFTAFCLLILITGCGTDKTAGKDSEDKGEEKKELRIVTDAEYAPFEYQDKGEVVGFDIDFIKAVAKEAGYTAKIEHIGWDPIFVELESGRADLAVSAITIDEERKQTYDFSHPYFASTNKILVPKGSDIKTAEDLKGKKVAVQTGTTGSAAAEAILGVNAKNLSKFENNNLAIMELNSGGAEAVVADNTVIEEYSRNNPDKNLFVIEDEDSFDKEYYGVMFPKGSKLPAEFNKAINTLYENGTYAEIFEDWFGKTPDIENLKEQQ